MLVPLVVLAIFSLVAGYVGIPQALAAAESHRADCRESSWRLEERALKLETGSRRYWSTF